ncbi:MAG: AAA family ATPase, partial [Clostridia bacterium]|nr:AAA family ATPase [Clostridia bacterium]
MLYRKIRKTIESTILSKDGKVLLLLGGRQTGKSHEIKDFASKHYKHFIEINIENDAAENRFFEKIKTIEDFHVGLKLFVGKELGTKDDTLIFFDNIHFYPQLIELVAKLGKEGKYNYVASSRAVLKLKNANLTDYFNVLTINPLDFEEFLLANGASEEGIENVRQMFKSKAAMPEVSHMYMMHMFRQYMLVGGLPEAVRVFAETGEIEKVREVQQNCIDLVEKGVYTFDNYFSGKTKLESIFRIIPEELLQKKKRITIKNIEGSTGKRFTDYKKEFDFLEDSYITTSSVAVR